jgi:hypothetical protein
MSLTGLTALSQNGQVIINSAAVSAAPISVLPLNSPPINGFTPYMVFGLTDEQDKNDTTFSAKASSSPGTAYSGAATLPVFQTPKYFVATVDTGSQAHLITYDQSLQFDLNGANRLGNYQAQIQGVNGIEDTEISDGLGLYSTGLSNATGFAGGTISVTAGTLKGLWNCSILNTEPESGLPALIGSPVLSRYQVVIQNSQTKHITVGTTTFRSPQVSFQTLNTAAPGGYFRLTNVNVQSANGVSPDAVFFPSFDNIENWADNPTTPSFWANLTAQATATHTGGSSGSQDFLFDTGAQVSVISEDTAASVGYFTGGPNPSTPDFYVAVTGVGGTIVQVPGFYMNQLTVTTNGGPISWTHVPVLVLDVPDPRDNVGFIPGILGMNLFTDRDLVINGGTSNPFIAISDIIASKWNVTGGGTWGDDSKWSLGSPDGADVPANFLSSITGAATVTVDSSGFTVGSIKFDNANRYTIAGPGTITIEAMSTGAGAINVVSGSHTISAPMVFHSDTTITVTPSGGSLNLSGSSIDGGSIGLTKTGAGLLAITHIRAGSFTINQGSVTVNSNGTSAGAGKVKALTLAGGTSPTVKLDMTNNAMVIDYSGSSPLATIAAQIKAGYNNGSWTGNGITSSTAAANAGLLHKTAIGYAEASQVGNPASLLGQTVDSTSLLLRYVYYGDANVDGSVNTVDFNILASNFGGAGRQWYQADFNFDSTITTIDFNLLASNFALTLPSDDLGGVIPEPASLLWIGATAFALRRRRSRHPFV